MKLLDSKDEDLDKLLATHVSHGSEKTYQYCWGKFVAYLISNDFLDILTPTHILKFFQSLVEDKLSLSYLRTYRSALATPLKLLGDEFDLARNFKLDLLFRHCKSHYKKPAPFFPKWDADKIITLISSEDFTNKCISDFSLLTNKTIFLVALACPKRITEFQAISIPDSNIDSNKIILKSFPNFSAKNHSHNFIPEDIVISPLENSSLCPVNCILEYLKFSQVVCQNLGISRPPQFWIASSGKPLTKSQIRHKFRNLILEGDPEAKADDIRFHSTRSIVASNLFRHFDLSVVMKNMNWRSNSTFAKYYLKPGINIRSKFVIGGKPINSDV